MGRGLIFTNVLTILLNDGCLNKIRLSLNVTSPFVASVVGCLIKEKESHSTVNPEKRKPNKIFLFIRLTFYWFYLSNSSNLSTVSFSTHTISNSHLHSTSFS
jgi:hypothetical protein